MKKLLTMIITIFIVLPIVGCGGGDDNVCTHNWLEADCQNPKRCGKCGHTKGGKIAHSVEVGVCEYCREFQNEELCNTVLSLLEEVPDNCQEAYEMLPETYDEIACANAVIKVESLFEKEKEKLKVVISMCGEHELLSETKSRLEDIISEWPTKLQGTGNERTEYFEYLMALINTSRHIMEVAAGLDWDIKCMLIDYGL